MRLDTVLKHCVETWRCGGLSREALQRRDSANVITRELLEIITASEEQSDSDK